LAKWEIGEMGSGEMGIGELAKWGGTSQQPKQPRVIISIASI